MSVTLSPGASETQRPIVPGPVPPHSQRDTATRRLPWEKIGFVSLLLVTAVLYFWNLSINDYGNSFYTAAAQAGADNWTAFFFGSSDMANSITVDKTPLSLWPMMLAVKIFGLNSYSLLGPEALLGVASVALLYRTVRRHHGVPAALIAGWALALTPVATLMFRFNNPDAMLVFLMIAAVWAGLRGVEDGRWRWVVAAGAFIGLGFLAKQLQVLLIVPPLALMWLICARGGVMRRIGQLLAAGASMVAAVAWYIAAVELWPADKRPYIGGSQNNSIIELTLGYNGLGRLNGNETGSVVPGGGQGQGGAWGETGIFRMFESAQGGQIAWLLPLALVLFVVGLWVTRTAARTSTIRASYIAWGGWLVATALTFSFMQGIFHQYYTVALAPAVAALVGAGLIDAHRSTSRVIHTVLATSMLGSSIWAYILLNRSSDFLPWLKFVVVAAGVITFVLIMIHTFAPRLLNPKMLLVSTLVAGSLTLLSGPLAYSLETVNSSNMGSIPTAGPAVAGGMGGPGGQGGPGGPGGQGGPDGHNGNMMLPTGGNDGNTGQAHGQQRPAPPSQNGTMPTPPNGSADGAGTPGGQAGQGGPGGGQGGPGGLLGGGDASTEVTSLLTANADSYTWVAATSGSQSAATYQLAAGYSVMPIGGFNGSDPSPTLEQFKQWIAEGKIHYYIVSDGPGGGAGGPGGENSDSSTERTSSQIQSWIEENFTAQTVDGVTMYDLSS